uniref:(northern house mosquito) hypothetical protein n=1 Tax=Culex pipiens TaxID=7175 RepID=A0A8D8C4A4_CULPI
MLVPSLQSLNSATALHCLILSSRRTRSLLVVKIGGISPFSPASPGSRLHQQVKRTTMNRCRFLAWPSFRLLSSSPSELPRAAAGVVLILLPDGRRKIGRVASSTV